MNLAYVDVVGGAAGDMLLAALLDAGADRDAVADAVSSVLHRRIECSTAEVNRRGLRALALSVPEDVSATRRTTRALIDAVERATLDDGVRERAISVLARLFQAEARVHGVPLESLELEELGTDDTLLDVVGIAAALDSLRIERLAVSSIPMPPPSDGGGHGSPPPVTLELLSGFALHASAAGRELAETVTPTAAAVFSALGESSPDMPTMVLGATGVGAGARDPSSIPNVVRLLIGSSQD
ncbi:MAG: nickel insertion protein, partial [Actinomycetota bacterium]